MSKRAYIFCLVVFIIGFLAAYIAGVEIGTKEGDNLKENRITKVIQRKWKATGLKV